MNASTGSARIVVTSPIHPEVRARLEEMGRVEMNSDAEPWNPQQLGVALAGAEAMMGFMTDCVDESLLAAAPRLRIVACALKGFDSYDVDACTRAGVWVSIVPDLLTEPTAELAIGLAISLARNVLAGDAQVRSGAFHGWRPRLYGSGLAGSSVAVVGLGRVGQAIVSRLAGFGCSRIIGVDPGTRRRGVEMLATESALAQADYVFVAAPLTPSSIHLLNAGALGHSKPGQFIINVGRGSVVDEEAVAAALEAGRLGGYAADVFACEDWALSQRPGDVPERLRQRSDTLFTPHLGSAVKNVRLAIEHRAADNIISVLQGRQPQDAVNRVESAMAGVG